jgi:hypothetical protein
MILGVLRNENWNLSQLSVPKGGEVHQDRRRKEDSNRMDRKECGEQKRRKG